MGECVHEWASMYACGVSCVFMCCMQVCVCICVCVYERVLWGRFSSACDKDCLLLLIMVRSSVLSSTQDATFIIT